METNKTSNENPKNPKNPLYRKGGWSFGEAFESIKKGDKGASSPVGMRLPEWDDKTFVSSYLPEAGDSLNHPFPVISRVWAEMPWSCTVAEMYRDDWQLVALDKKGRIIREQTTD